MTDLACPDCGHNVVLHDGQGCTVSSCDCTTPPPPAARQTWRDPDGKPYMWSSPPRSRRVVRPWFASTWLDAVCPALRRPTRSRRDASTEGVTAGMASACDHSAA